MNLKRLIFSSILALTAVLSQAFLTPATLHAAVPDQKITIKTYFTATSAQKAGESTPWPQIVLFANNATGFEGAMDYGSCLIPGPLNNCGTAALYDDRKIDNFTVAGTTFTQTTTTSSSKLFIYPYADRLEASITKLSYAFYNDYWNPIDKKDRDVFITKIELLGPDNKVFKTYTPQDDSYSQGHGGNNLHQTIYFDYGLLSTDNVKQSDQHGFTLGFDKDNFQSIVKNKSRENNKWNIEREGTFNITSDDLYTTFKAKYAGTTNNRDTNKSCTVSLVANPAVIAGKIVQGKTITYTVTATSNRATLEGVNFFVKKLDTTKITPLPTDTTEVIYGANHYYRFRSPVCKTGSSESCAATITVPALAIGKYQVHCDMGELPNACSGNPNCKYEGGTFACASFISCSNTDNASFEVIADVPPTRTPDYNGSHTVDIFDYNKLLSNYGKTDCALNLAGQCVLDTADYDLLVSVFGKNY